MFKRSQPKRLRSTTRTFLPGVKRAKLLSYLLGLFSGLCVFALLCAYALLGPSDNRVQAMLSSSKTQDLHKQIEQSRKETSDLREELSRTQALMKLDRDTGNKLTLLINNLETENARLKEDLAFFEGFVPGSLQSAISLKRFEVTKDTVPDQYRYKALVIQGSQRPDITLNIQVLVKVLNKGKVDVIVLPTESELNEPQFKIKLTRFSRVTGLFSVPPEAKVQSVEMRILEAGAIRAQSLIQL